MKMQKGFTLIELMIVVVIVAILASVSMPLYSDYVRRGKLVQATSSLSDLRTRMEQYYQDNRNYGSTATTCGVAMSTSLDNQYFTYSCNWGTSVLDNQHFTITATGKAAQGLSNFTYTINEANVKTSTTSWDNGVTWNNGATCWIMKKGGTC